MKLAWHCLLAHLALASVPSATGTSSLRKPGKRKLQSSAGVIGLALIDADSNEKILDLANGDVIDLSRLVVTTDAGVGKTTLASIFAVSRRTSEGRDMR